MRAWIAILALCTAAAGLGFGREALALIGGHLDVRTCGTYVSAENLSRLAAERRLLRTLWRGRRVAIPLARVPAGTALLDTRGGPRRHFWLVHDDRGFIAFRATPAVPRLREEDVEFRARWNGLAWEARAASEGTPPVFFFHRTAHTFDREGRRIVGPSYRDLDRFPVEVAGDAVVVDTRTILYGHPRATEGAGCFP